ncbi:hypothetical protein, partial [Acidithiobacillus ferriphilus]|uniref:hypothetical protein n=1 Tax=Acidithiobacillus ferriphilus TaxID=1689834 RepID=UPI002DB984BD
MEDKCRALKEILFGMDNGLIAPQFIKRVKEQLIEAWPYIKGSDAEKTFSDKLCRIEKLTWNNPLLEFILERHGPTVSGSSRAPLHIWSVDVTKMKATVKKGKYRQLEKRSKKFQFKKAIEEVINLVVSKSDHEWLDWDPERNRARIFITRIIPNNAPGQTVSGRRRRFRELLQPALKEVGWSFEVEDNRIGSSSFQVGS